MLLNWLQPLVQTVKTPTTDSIPQRKLQNSLAVYRLSSKVVNGKRYLSATPAFGHSGGHFTIGHLPALKLPPGRGLTTITTKQETKAILPSYAISVKNGSKSFLPSGQRVLLTMKLCTFKTSRQEISHGLWLSDP